MISTIKKTFNNLVKKGLDEGLSNMEYVRGKMINSFILIYILASLPFLFLRLFQGAFGSSLINIFLIVQLSVAYFISIKKGHQLGAIYFLAIMLIFQCMLLFSAFHITVFLYLAALPVLFALLFNTSIKRNALFIITFCLILVYYYYHNSHINLVINYINIIGISYFIISRFVELIEKNQKALNLALKEKELIIEKLHKRNKELEQFNFLTSHDLQEPLKTITTYSELLLTKKGKDLDRLSINSLNFMNQAANRMSSLIHDLFNYTRIGALSSVDIVDLQEILELSKRDLQNNNPDRNINIIFGQLPTVIGYKKELKLLLDNLLSNAVKFSKAEEAPFIKITSSSEEEAWKITVKDNGIGIEADAYSRIFKMFQRLQPKGSSLGNGSGLAYCHKIVELHHGKIWVDSVVGAGSAFHFTISKNIKLEQKAAFVKEPLEVAATSTVEVFASN